MPVFLLYALGGSAVLTAFGFAVDKTGEGVNDAADGLVKLALVGGAGFILAKKFKVI